MVALPAVRCFPPLLALKRGRRVGVHLPRRGRARAWFGARSGGRRGQPRARRLDRRRDAQLCAVWVSPSPPIDRHSAVDTRVEPKRESLTTSWNHAVRGTRPKRVFPDGVGRIRQAEEGAGEEAGGGAQARAGDAIGRDGQDEEREGPAGESHGGRALLGRVGITNRIAPLSGASKPRNDHGAR